MPWFHLTLLMRSTTSPFDSVNLALRWQRW